MLKKNARRKLILSLSAVAVCSSLFAVKTNASTGKPIRIGMTVSSTGSFALASQSGVRGIEVWVNDVNSRGGIELDGKKRLVELIKRDDRSDKQMVTRVYEALINDDKVDLVFGPFGSTLNTVAITTTERHKMFMLVWAAAVDKIFEQGFKYIVSATQIPASRQLNYPIEFAAKIGVKKIAMVYSDEPFPSAVAEFARERAQEHGMEVVMFERYPKGQKDFSTLLQKARASGADGFVPHSYEGDQVSMLRQMKQMNIMFPYTFLFYAATPQFQDIGSDTDYIFSNTNYNESINWKVNAGMDRGRFANAYEANFPKAEFKPDFQTAMGYGAGVILEEIIKKADSLDAAKLKQTALDLSDKLTVMPGPYAIDQTGKQLKMPWPVVQLLPNKGMATVYPDDVANARPVYPIPEWSQR